MSVVPLCKMETSENSNISSVFDGGISTLLIDYLLYLFRFYLTGKCSLYFFGPLDGVFKTSSLMS